MLFLLLQVRITDAKKLESDPVAKITLPQRVPYGFHGPFVPKTIIQLGLMYMVLF